jgi:hypothetical protein
MRTGATPANANFSNVDGSHSHEIPIPIAHGRKPGTDKPVPGDGGGCAPRGVPGPGPQVLGSDALGIAALQPADIEFEGFSRTALSESHACFDDHWTIHALRKPTGAWVTVQ